MVLPSCQQIGGKGRAGVWPCPLVRVGAGSRADRPEGPPPMPTVGLIAVPWPVPAASPAAATPALALAAWPAPAGA